MAVSKSFFTSTNAGKPDTNKVSLKERFSALGNLPAFFKLVWHTSPSLTVTNAILRIVRSAIPVAILYVGKLIIDGVVQISHGVHLSHTYLWQLVAIELALAILSDGLSRATNLVDSLLGDLFSNFTSIKIMQHAATLDLEQFEDSTFYDKLERARQQTIGRTVLLSQVLSQVQDLITVMFFAAGLVVFNPWLILILLSLCYLHFSVSRILMTKLFPQQKTNTGTKRVGLYPLHWRQ